MENKKRKPSKTITPGVRAFGNRFQAFCYTKGKFISIGYKDTAEEAAELRSEYMLANVVPGKRGRPRKSEI